MQQEYRKLERKFKRNHLLSQWKELQEDVRKHNEEYDESMSVGEYLFNQECELEAERQAGSGSVMKLGEGSW